MTNTGSRRVALVTGGTGGIGSGVALALTERGFDVVVSDLKIAGEAIEAMKAGAAPGAQLHFVQGNVADVDDHPRFVSEAISAFGRLDSLVNVAGVSAKSRGDLLDVSTDSYDFNFAVNTRGAFFVTQAVSRRMIQEDPQGDESARSVIFVTSSNAAIAAPERGEYAMSKAAATMMTKLYALRLAEHGIAVYEVRPGLIKTPMTGAAQERYDKLLAQGFTPINRWGTPNDIGRAVASLAFGDLPFTQAPLFRSTAECTSTTTETTAQPEQGACRVDAWCSDTISEGTLLDGAGRGAERARGGRGSRTSRSRGCHGHCPCRRSVWLVCDSVGEMNPHAVDLAVPWKGSGRGVTDAGQRVDLVSEGGLAH